ncbi:MAG TPA: NAD-dependent dehydratase, partial [Mycobacterium sp.]|nr:NAD-dependent dehydratase [Mycobacterium sp.]
YARDRGLPAVAMCVSNPYGPLDWQPHQGLMVKMAALGKMPVYVKDVSTEVVGIEDVAEAFLLAAERGRVGERYIISESFMPMRQMFETAASAVGAKPPRFGVPLAMLYAVGWIMGVASRVLRRDLSMNLTGVRLLHIMSAADHSKATRELGWVPRPTAESIRRAAQFYVEQARSA